MTLPKPEYVVRTGVRRLIDAALDQPSPSPVLVAALNDLLQLMAHKHRLRPVASRDEFELRS